MSSTPLDIVIVGAGIGGLAAAVSCRRAGHNVAIYERSPMNSEVGAAIHVGPNGSRGLLAWGLDPVRARFVTTKRSYKARGDTLEKFYESDESYIPWKFGSPWFLAHRVDLHEELKRLATEAEGEGKPAELHLNSAVKSYDPEAGSVTLSDGRTISGDLIIAADGVHSVAVEAVLGHPNQATPTTRDNFAYRILIPTSDITSDPETAHFSEGDDGTMKILTGDGRRLAWYPCRNNEEHNIVAIFHNDEKVAHDDWNTPIDTETILKRYSDFHPSILAVLKKAKGAKQWPLLYRAPIPTWHKRKLVLVGDAAHPMLPHQGQGGCQAIEDGISIGMFLSNCSPESIPKRIEAWENLRIKRASAIQILSNAGQDEPERIQEEAAQFIPAESVPKNPADFYEYNFGYNVIEHATKSLLQLDPAWSLPQNFFQNKPAGLGHA